MKKIANILLIIGYACFITSMLGYTILKVHGYKYDVTANQITSTGIIDIISYPSGADIYLDEGKYNGKTKAIIRPEPGKHTIMLEKNGFFPVEKNVEVNPKNAVQIELRLLPNPEINKPEKIMKSIQLVEINPFNNSLAAFADNANNRLFIYNLNSKAIEKSVKIPKQITRFVWQEDSLLVYQTEDRNIHTYKLTTDETTSFSITPENYKKFLGDGQRTELSKTIPFLLGKDVSNFKILWNKQKLYYNNKYAIFLCDLQNQKCETVIRFSEEIGKTVYLESGVLIRLENSITFYDFSQARKAIDIDTNSPFAYLPYTQEILFSQEGILYRWKIFHN